MAEFVLLTAYSEHQTITLTLKIGEPRPVSTFELRVTDDQSNPLIFDTDAFRTIRRLALDIDPFKERPDKNKDCAVFDTEANSFDCLLNSATSATIRYKTKVFLNGDQEETVRGDFTEIRPECPSACGVG